MYNIRTFCDTTDMHSTFEIIDMARQMIKLKYL